VQKTLRRADIHKIVTCDNNYDKTYYAFLNDDAGTVLVNRYDLTRDNIWCVYRGDLFRNITGAFVFNGNLFFANQTEVFCLDEDMRKDASTVPGGESVSIKANWESGFMGFGADFLRKYVSHIYISVLPEAKSKLTVTAQTDRRETYMEKQISGNVFSFGNLDFSEFTFETSTAPKIKRIRMKVKKFVYYKLIFRVDGDGAAATVLGFDQEVRFGSMAK
jgi:hypothetical protein